MAVPKHRSTKTRKNVRNSSKLIYSYSRKIFSNELAFYNALVIHNELVLGKYYKYTISNNIRQKVND